MPDSGLPIQTGSEEKNELQKELDKIASHPKMARWISLFLDKTNKQTYGNKTQSAILAYNLYPITQYASASVMGHENLKKLKTLASTYHDADGMTTGKVLDLIAAHAVAGKQKALEMLADLTGVWNPKAQVLIQNNTQVNNTTIQETAQEIETAKQEFRDFINAKYKNSTVTDGTNSEV